MVAKNLWEFVTVCLTFVSLVESKSAIRKRNVTGGLEAILEAQINSFSESSFATDVKFVQHVDKVNKVSLYRLSAEAGNVYERNQDDSGKTTIVFTKDEDSIPFKKTKRAYVVLKRGNVASFYHAKLALLRDATPQDKNPVLIDGKGQVVEWTIYDDHLISGRESYTLAALTCVSSILVPCLFNESVLTPPDKFIPAPRFNQKQSPKSFIEEVESIKLKTEDGSDPDVNYDYYIDLEVNKVQGRILITLLSGVGGIVPGLLGTVTGLLCGVLGLSSVCPVGVSGIPYIPIIGRRKKRNSQREGTAHPDLHKVMEYPGWKTQYLNPSKDITFTHENEIFFGFGNCPYVQVKPVDLLNAQNPHDIIHHYVTVLKADCIPSTVLIIQGLLKDGLLSVALNDKIFQIAPDHNSITNPGLSMKDLLNLNTATELAAFSNVYVKQAESHPTASTKITAPGGQRQISRSIHFIVQVSLTYLKITREKVRAHILHLTRNLLMNVLSVFTKLAQDSQNLQSCADCTKDKEVNLNDLLTIMSLNQFIKRGLGPVERGTEVFASFDTFFKQNEADILKFVNVYS